MRFEWDAGKDRANLQKHGIPFDAAKEVFGDPFHISVLDRRFDYFDERWITIGASSNCGVLVVGHLYYLTGEGEEVIRIITARKAAKKERKQHERIG